MKLSTQTDVLKRNFGYKKAIQFIKEAGFDCFDLSLFDIYKVDDEFSREDYRDVAKKLRDFSDSIGIECNQTHAPYPSYKKGDDEFNKIAFELNVKSLIISSIIGAKVCVIHASEELTEEENFKFIYAPLKEYSIKYNVVVATENTWHWNEDRSKREVYPCTTTDSYKKLLEQADESWFMGCLDIGHAEMFQGKVSAVELIKTLGKRIRCLHVHDNDLFNDNHTFPYNGKINWDPIYKCLKDIGYEYDLTFEADSFLLQYPSELHKECVKFLEKIGRYMIARIGM